MEIVNTAKFVIGIVLVVAGLGLLIASRGTRGFNQRRQIGLLLLVGGALFVSVGLGLFETPW